MTIKNVSLTNIGLIDLNLLLLQSSLKESVNSMQDKNVYTQKTHK